MSILDRLAAAVEGKGQIELDDLAEVSEIENHSVELATSPFAPLIAEAFVTAMTRQIPTPSTTDALLAFAQGLHLQASYLALREACDHLLDEGQTRSVVARELHDSLLPTPEIIQSAPLLAALRLDIVLEITLLESLPHYDLLAILTRPVEGAPSEYINSLPRLIGRAGDAWMGVDDQSVFLSTLHALADVGAEDAAFELSIHELRDAVRAETIDDVYRGVQTARDGFLAIVNAEEAREDAGGYLYACEAVMAFHDQDKEALRAASANARATANLRSLLLHGMNQRSLRIAHRASQLAWHSLAWRLETAALELEHEEFLDTWVAVDAIIDVYANDRQTMSTERLSGLIQPRVENTIARHASMVRQLERAVAADAQAPTQTLGRAATDLLNLVHQRGGSREAAGSARTEEPVPVVYLSALIGNEGVAAIANQSSEELDKLETLARELTFGRLSTSPHIHNATLDPLVADLLEELDRNPNFIDTPRLDFSLLVLLTVRFVAMIGDTAQTYTRTFKDVDEAPKEAELQKHFYEFLCSSELAGRVGMEHSNIGNGRADVITTFDNAARYVTEIKRELQNASKEHIESAYLAQTLEYQAANVPLGQLLVLDLTSHKGGTPHLGESIWVAHRETSADSVAQSAVLGIVRGNRPTPSKMG